MKVVRKVNNMVILFYDATTIYVKHRYGVNRYDRWFVKQRGFYTKNWKPFRQYLIETLDLSMPYINSLAEKYEINIGWTDKMPDITGAIEVHGRIRRN